jgi:ferritin-like protein
MPAELNANNEIRELETKHHSKAYLNELEEIKGKLPKEIKDFADVFSSEE